MIAISALISCAQGEKKAYKWTEIEGGKWNSSVKIIENNSKKTHAFELAFKAIKGKKTRLDITAFMGTPIASMVIEDGKMEAAIIRQKKIYWGKPTSEVLKHALGFGFDPKVISSVIFETLPVGEKWDCNIDTETAKRCVSPKEDLIINWENRNDLKRSVKLETAEFVVEISFNGYVPDELLEPKTFVIKRPKSFKVIELK